MIYLIKSPAWVEQDKKFINILKIGFTEDNKSEKRFKTYLSHNPTSRVLLKLPGFGVDVEEALHNKFSIHRFIGKEWYIYCDEIINFFFSPDLPQKLKELEKDGKKLLEKKSWIRKQLLYRYILSLFSPKRLSISSKEIQEENEFWNLVKEEKTSEENIKLETRIRKFYELPKELKEIIEDLAIKKSLKKKIEVLKEAEICLLDCDLDNLLTNWVDQETLMQYENG